MIKIIQWIAGNDVHFYLRGMTKLEAMYDGVHVVTVASTGVNSLNILSGVHLGLSQKSSLR